MEFPDSAYPCHINPELSSEQFIPEHIFIYMKAGSITVNDSVQSYHIQVGEFCFAKRNYLAKYVKHPDRNGKLEAISIIFKREFLKNFRQDYKIVQATQFPEKSAIIRLESNVLLESFVRSLIPYLAEDESGYGDFLSLKNKEIVMILLRTNPDLRSVLFDFNDPGKIDLEDFMNKSFRFNVSLERFAYLSGRSLTSFKQDFKKIFRMSPGRWLLNKRLQEAHHLIQDKKRKPSDIYLEIGFEDLSHFSFTFKKRFGVSPSHLF